MKKKILICASFAILAIAGFNTVSYSESNSNSLGLGAVFAITNANAEGGDAYEYKKTTTGTTDDGTMCCEFESVTCHGTGTTGCTPGLSVFNCEVTV